MNYISNSRNQEDINSTCWDIIEVSKVNDIIIKNLIDKLNLGICDDFFISFESLIKLGKRAKSGIISYIENNGLDSFIKNVLVYILYYINHEEFDLPLVISLYHTDFIIRAKTIMRIEEDGIEPYLNFILPLINDPDDSVRWAVIKLLVTNNLIKNPLVREHLKDHLKQELNPIIKKNIMTFLDK
ncbi:MAG: HEAT repeat domain-containing protein [Candidatus Lokiarchaeota archaeon]|nr:HEAT repeat domain-containing protein [Candidatus Lokiarchaeota archaeon]